MTTTRQSIVTWHPWPENGVEGLPKGEHRIFIRTAEGVEWRVFELRGHVSQMLIAGKIGITHYALASDLETILIDDQQPVAPHSPKQISGTSPDDPTFKESLKVQDEDRVRWLVEQAAVLMCACDDMTEEMAVEWVRRIELKARAQMERERKEGGHG